jgi:hypothetical protein
MRKNVNGPVNMGSTVKSSSGQRQKDQLINSYARQARKVPSATLHTPGRAHIAGVASGAPLRSVLHPWSHALSMPIKVIT